MCAVLLNDTRPPEIPGDLLRELERPFQALHISKWEGVHVGGVLTGGKGL